MNDERRPVPAASSVAARGCRWATTRLARGRASGAQGGAGSVWAGAPRLRAPATTADLLSNQELLAQARRALRADFWLRTLGSPTRMHGTSR